MHRRARAISQAIPGAAAAPGIAQRLGAFPPAGRLPWWASRLVFLLLAAGVGVRGVLNGPWYQDRKLAAMSLAALQRERGDRMDDPRLLYYTGLRLNEQGRFAEADPLLRQA